MKRVLAVTSSVDRPPSPRSSPKAHPELAQALMCTGTGAAVVAAVCFIQQGACMVHTC